MKKVGIIGAGPSGLCAIRHCIKEGFEVIAFEQNDDIGGEWLVTGAVGENKYGIDAHSSIYEGLITNLPKEVMAFPDYPYDESVEESFMTPDTVFSYLNSYADAFQLRKHIKLEHQVIKVCPLPKTDTWEILVKDLPTDSMKKFIFDFIFVCNGISSPWLPKFEGQKNFKGNSMHSHDYRNTKVFEHERVLVVGSGPSALDVVLQVQEVAECLFWVHKVKEKFGSDVNIGHYDNIKEKSAIKRLTSNGAEFIDGSTEEFSWIIYATGFDYSFPFLSVDSGLSVDDKKVYPLFKHCININKPSLAILGLPFVRIAMPLFDLQVRFCLEFWSQRMQIPSKEEMIADTNKDLENRQKMGFGNHKTHFLGPIKTSEYFEELALAACIEPLKPVFGLMFDDSLSKFIENYLTFRHYKYRILSDTEFECVPWNGKN